MNAQVCWLYEVTVKAGQAGTFRALMAELAGSAQAEQGTLVYEWALSDDQSMAHIHERYADSAATLTHLTMFRDTFAQRFLETAEPVRLVVYGTPSEQVKEALTESGPVYMGAFTGFAR